MELKIVRQKQLTTISLDPDVLYEARKMNINISAAAQLGIIAETKNKQDYLRFIKERNKYV